MKVWLKFLIGAFLGVTLGFLVPSDNQTVADSIAWLSELAIRIGRYSLVPILVFSLTIAVYELRQESQFWRLILKTFAVMLASSVFVIGAGILAAFAFPPARIPVFVVEQTEAVALATADSILAAFPSTMFAAIVGDGMYVFPACVFAFFLGIGLSYDRLYTKPI
ncbi:MAG: dicarboxylate/amino acid:cation symporter, partial [Treponema sp.]|nr:dicarboxylate/amino acid:cation symporter [Treponema sp.]